MSPAEVTPYRDFGDRLRRAREAKGWTQPQASERSGTDVQSLGRYERGERMPAADALLPLARSLDVTMEYLVTGENKNATHGSPPLRLGENEAEAIRNSEGPAVQVRVPDARYDPIFPESTMLVVSTKSARLGAGILVLEQRMDDASWSRQLVISAPNGRKPVLLSITEPFRPVQAGEEGKLFPVMEIRLPR